MTENGNVETLKGQVRQLIVVGGNLVAALNAQTNDESHRLMILIGWTSKVTKMLRSLLAEFEGLAPENSLIHARILFEIGVNFRYFAKELAADSDETVTRFWDAMDLQMDKKFRLMVAHPQADALSQEVCQSVADAHSHASTHIADRREVKAIESHGFYGKSIEARCKEMDRKHHYDLLYRPFCDPIHAADILHCAVMVVRPGEAAAIVTDLTAAALAVGYDTGMVVLTVVDAICGGQLTGDLDLIKVGTDNPRSSQLTIN